MFGNKAKILMKEKNRYVCICDKTKLNNESNELLQNNDKIKKKKFGNKKVVMDGITYDSRTEYNRFCELSLLERSGEISDLHHHVPFVLIDKSEYGSQIKYVADFTYKDKRGKFIVEDVKVEPTKTQLYLLKKRLLAERYGLIISEYME